MSKKKFYRCENEYGDPCEYALEGRRIPESEVLLGMDGKTRCPGKTQSGKECGSELIPIPGGGGGIPKAVLIAAAVLVVLAALGGAGYWLMGSGGIPQIKVEPAALIFPRTETGGKATVSLQIFNDGDGELVIERCEVNLPEFSAPTEKLMVSAGGSGSFQVQFNSSSRVMTQGELLVYSNAQDSPVIIPLIANQDPWWVYRKLEKSSKILSARQ